MSCLKSFDGRELQLAWSGGACRNDIRDGGISFAFRLLVFRLTNFLASCVLAVLCFSAEISHAQTDDIGIYKRAVEFCRAVAKRPMALDLDRRVLCFDGLISDGPDFSPANGLEPNGLFVVRSLGGEAISAMRIADWIRDRRATVVVYDYCFSACASFLFVASDKTFVVGGTLVAWHHSDRPFCPQLKVADDLGPKRLEKVPCSDTSLEVQAAYRANDDQYAEFYASRVIDPLFKNPPESFAIRRRLKNMFEGNGGYPDVMWTWHPRYLASTLKAKIVYEAYPSSQIEVDAQLSKLGFRYRILHDP